MASAAISLKLGTSGRAGVAKGKAPEPAVAVSQTAPAPVQASASASANGKIAISQVELGTVFPVFYAWYDNHPLGTVTITNSGTEAVENLKVSFFVESFMDNPKSSPSPASLQPGESAEVPVFALFNNKMMEVSEGTKASYRVIIDYTVADQKKNEERVDTLSLYDRNSLAWDDDRKAAVFVTAKDQSVLSFAKNTAAMAPENEAVDGNLRTAMAVHEALRLYGMSYIVDPASSYTDLSKKESAVDYLQFPRQTLEYKSGDCDDLTILYCSLLESVNIETAFITIPGHIFMAFALETSPDESRKKYLKADDFIFLDGKTWVPLEITMTKEHFLRIWQEGTKEWLENSSREQAVLIPVRKAWGDYRPVGFPGSFSINLPAKAPVVEATAAEVTKFINREIASRVAQYQADINSSQGDPKTVNKLGVLYAKYGLYAEAAREFERAVAVREHAPSLLNLGNLAFHTGDFAKAYSWYSRVVALEPKNALAVLGMARVAHELENYGEVKNLYATLQTLNPDYARQFAYLDLRGAEATRAADVGQVKGILIWGDE